jgi:hypothetical protein
VNFGCGAFFFAIVLNPLLLIFHQTLYRRILDSLASLKEEDPQIAAR